MALNSSRLNLAPLDFRVQEGEQALASLLYARLVALNNPIFDFQSCNYTEKNINRPDKVRAVCTPDCKQLPASCSML